MLHYEYKLRVYELSGSNKGNLRTEEFFASREGLLKRYREVFRKELYSLNPTAWQYVDGEWERILL